MKEIPLSAYGGARTDVDLGTSGLYTFVTKFNYSAPCWVLDIYDANDIEVLTGLMLVPGVNLLHPYPAENELIGSLVLYEDFTGEYLLPNSLGETTHLVWTSPTEFIEA